MKFNITSGKIEQDSPFPVDASALIGLSPDNMQILCTAEVSLNDNLIVIQKQFLIFIYFFCRAKITYVFCAMVIELYTR